MRWLERICLFVRLSVCLHGTDVHFDHTVHFGADLSLWSDSNVLGIQTPKHVHTYFQPSFSSYLEERWGMDVQTMCDISRTVEDRG